MLVFVSPINGWVCLRTPDMRTSDSNLFQKPWHIRKSCKAESLQGWRKRWEKIVMHFLTNLMTDFHSLFWPICSEQNIFVFSKSMIIHVSSESFHWKPLFIQLESLLEETLSLLKHRQVPLKTSYLSPWWFQFPTRFCLVWSGIKHLVLLAAWFLCPVLSGADCLKF